MRFGEMVWLLRHKKITDRAVKQASGNLILHQGDSGERDRRKKSSRSSSSSSSSRRKRRKRKEREKDCLLSFEKLLGTPEGVLFDAFSVVHALSD